ncbi:hypothetical protein SDRG_17228 [Saprolegnia diclina VS20]|uniref:RWP-RK domain-containing protein n=1 Tax=Saprolegnia diclina (strain VS20) TaxID=1156394 RepID=T0QYQ5_SAPDV|nr:hypothetical protein SDRG_17228 [Saprolegnia diclina VS20]EQC24883.1 hypothetical protein SDRG_17228 [Saprolegnia diclina VS20]|eukprot:XP_008621690.1 hypothetical protein SDRG_17228 [Saprolegnia diclina VS20]
MFKDIQAAAKLDSYEGALIRLCRSRGYSKWPYRQLAAIAKKIKRLEAILAEKPSISMPLVQALLEQHRAEYQAVKYCKPVVNNPKQTAQQDTSRKMSLDFIMGCDE